MKPSLSQRIHRIMTRNANACMHQKIAFQMLINELDESSLRELHPDSFARTWRQHRQSFKRVA